MKCKYLHRNGEFSSGAKYDDFFVNICENDDYFNNSQQFILFSDKMIIIVY